MSYSDGVTLPADCPDWQRHILTDPQTSGGLLIACEPTRAQALLDVIIAAGYPSARIIGHTQTGTPSVQVML
jgi:selenide,water dikinase